MTAYTAQLRIAHQLSESARAAIDRTVSLARGVYDLEHRAFPAAAEISTFEALASLVATVEAPSFYQRLSDIRDPLFSPSLPTTTWGTGEASGLPRLSSPMSVSRPGSPFHASAIPGPAGPSSRDDPMSPRSPPAKRHRADSSVIPDVSEAPRPPASTISSLPSFSGLQPIGLAASTSHDARLEGQVSPFAPTLRTVSSTPALLAFPPGLSPGPSTKVPPVLKRKKSQGG